jgi:capsular polysaccharide transport system permease protein
MPAFGRMSLPPMAETRSGGIFGPFKRFPFTFAVILPSILAGLYLFLVAAPQYYSETRFMLRGQQRGAASILGEALSSAGFKAPSEDSASVRDYLLSHDAVQTLQQRMDLVSVFRRPEADPLFRLWYPTPTTERLLDYYRGQVTARIESSTGITELRVRTFRPLDSLEMSRQLLQMSEELVNQMNRRITEETVRVSRLEVQRAEQRVAEATQAITAFRQREQALDPSRSAGIAVEAIGRLEAEGTRLRAELQQLQTFARPNNPQIQNLRNRIEGIDAQVAEERRRLATAGTGVTEQIAAFERLRLEAEFAGRQLTMATAGLERAMAEAQRQQLFLLRVVEPNLAERSLYPKPLAFTAYVFVALTLVYGLVALVIAGIKEHAA